MKLVWKFSDVLTGRYKSFERRAWPYAEWMDAKGETFSACTISCIDEYIPKYARSGNHFPLTLFIMDYTKPDGNCPWTRVKVDKSFKTKDELKLWFKENCDRFAPKGD